MSAAEKTMILELLLNSIKYKHPDLEKSGDPILLVNLIWPRPLISERESIVPLSLSAYETRFDGNSWVSRILFKEKVLGPFGIEVAITEKTRESDAASFFKTISSSLIKLSESEVSNAAGSVMSGGLVRLPFKYLEHLIKKPKQKAPKIIAFGSLDLHPVKSWKGKPQKLLQIPITAKDNTYKVTRRSGKGGVKTSRKLIIKKGALVGQIVLLGKLHAG